MEGKASAESRSRLIRRMLRGREPVWGQWSQRELESETGDIAKGRELKAL